MLVRVRVRVMDSVRYKDGLCLPVLQLELGLSLGLGLWLGYDHGLCLSEEKRLGLV